MDFSILFLIDSVILFILNISITKKLYGTVINFITYNNLLFLPKMIQYLSCVPVIRERIYFSIFLAYCFFNLGIIVIVFSKTFNKINCVNKIEISNISQKELLYSFYVLSVLIIYYYYKHPSPLFSVEKDLQRQLYASENGIFLRIPKYVLPFLFFMLLFSNKSKRENDIYFFMLCVFTLLIGHKSSVLSTIISVFLFLLVFNLKDKINIGLYIGLGGLSLVLMFFLLMGVAGKDLVWAIIKRLTLSDEGGIYIYEEFIPKHGFTLGKTIFNEMGAFLSKISLGLIPSSEQFMTTGQYIGSIKVGYKTPFELVEPGFSEFYLNFGYFGIVLFSFFGGIAISFLIIKSKITKSVSVRVLNYLLSICLISVFFNGKIGSTIISPIVSYLFTFCIFIFGKIMCNTFLKYSLGNRFENCN